MKNLTIKLLSLLLVLCFAFSTIACTSTDENLENLENESTSGESSDSSTTSGANSSTSTENTSSNVFTDLSSYIVLNGDYDYEDHNYLYLFGTDYSSDYSSTYTTAGFY